MTSDPKNNYRFLKHKLSAFQKHIVWKKSKKSLFRSIFKYVLLSVCPCVCVSVCVCVCPSYTSLHLSAPHFLVFLNPQSSILSFLVFFNPQSSILSSKFWGWSMSLCGGWWWWWWWCWWCVCVCVCASCTSLHLIYHPSQYLTIPQLPSLTIPHHPSSLSSKFLTTL